MRRSERTAERSTAKRSGLWLGMGLGAIGAAAVAVVLVLVGPAIDLGGIEGRTIDRSGPALLESIRNISQYHAAVGDFQIVLDVEKDVRFVPLQLAGERTLFVAAGTVNAYVDFSDIASDDLEVSADGTAVRLRLPEPVLDKPNLDQQRTYLFAQERGALDRLLGPADQQQYYLLAEQRIAEAAKESGIAERAAANTKAMLIALFNRLGYRVSFVEP